MQALTQHEIDRAKCPSTKTHVTLRDRVAGFHVRIYESGKKTFFYRYRSLNGIMAEKKIADANLVPLNEARSIASRIAADLAQGINPFPKVVVSDPVPTMAEFVAGHYLPHVKSYKKSVGTDISLLGNHIIPKLGKLPLDEIKRHELVSLFSEHRLTHAAGSTNRIIILVRYLFNLAIRWELGIEKNPADNIPLYPDSKKIERFLTPDDAQRLFGALEQSEAPMLKNIVAMLLLTGARKNEVLQARWSDFDFENRLWLIEFNKTGKPRYVPLSESAVSLLQSLPRIDGCDFPFANPKTKKPFVQIFWAWDSARKKAGMPELRIHDLRHSFASFLVNSGRSLYEVQKLLGHTQIKTTQRYAHLAKDTLLDAANLASQSVPLALVMPAKAEAVPMIAANQN